MTEREVLLVEEVAEWFVDLAKNDPVSADLVEDAIDRLAADGPGLGRPLVDRVPGSRIPIADARYDAHLAELDAREHQ